MTESSNGPVHIAETLPSVVRRLKQRQRNANYDAPIEDSNVWYIVYNRNYRRFEMSHFPSGTISHITFPAVGFNVETYHLSTGKRTFDNSLIQHHATRAEQLKKTIRK
jgi:hypothetical protein